MNVRLKVKCQTKTENAGNFFSLVFTPVTTGSEENKEFYKWTPMGDIKFDTINPIAAANFQVGKEYYLDFISAE